MAEPPRKTRLARPADAQRIDVLMKQSIRDIFPLFYGFTLREHTHIKLPDDVMIAGAAKPIGPI